MDSANNSFVVPPGKRRKRIQQIASDSESDSEDNSVVHEDDGSSSESDNESGLLDSVALETSSIRYEGDSDASSAEADESMRSNVHESNANYVSSKSIESELENSVALETSSIIQNEDSDASAEDADESVRSKQQTNIRESNKSKFQTSASLETSSILQDDDSNALFEEAADELPVSDKRPPRTSNNNNSVSDKSSLYEDSITVDQSSVEKNEEYDDVLPTKPDSNLNMSIARNTIVSDEDEPEVHSFSSDDAIETSYIEPLNYTVRPQANSTIYQEPNEASFEFVPDSDQEDADIESRCFSPRTRQSMGGRYVPDVSSDEDEEPVDVKNDLRNDEVSKSIVLSDSDTENQPQNVSRDMKFNSKSRQSGSFAEKKEKETTVILSSDDEVIVSPPIRPPPKSVGKLKYVSQKYYEDQLRARNEVITQITKSKKLLLTLNLPDNGAAMRRNVDAMERKLVTMNDQLDLLRVEEDKPTAKASIRDDWSQISDAINKIQPIHTGVKGMSTFNTQKTLTVDRLHQLHESMRTCPSEDTLADAPAGLKVELMDHQRYALGWLMWREKQRPRGGILADDMGLGKTLTMISLVLAMHQMAEGGDHESSSDSDPETADTDDHRRKSLHHGGTLVVCPASLIRQWESEVESRLKRNLLSVVVHHGLKREDRPKYLARADMVITTYAIVSRECTSNAALFGVRWKRIILDESHIIRNYKSQQSEACFKLKGTFRWSLTGTPIQNKEMDMFAQLKFLRCTPFDDLVVYKKWIGNQSTGNQERMNNVVQPLLLRRTKVQLQERGELQGLPSKTVTVMPVILDKDEMNVYQKIMSFSKTLFAQFLHQRAERDNDTFFRDGSNRPTFMQTRAPNGAYDKMHQRVKRMHGQEDIKSHQILTYILRLRQICCHPGLIDAMLEDDDGSSEHSMSLPEVDLLEQLNKLNLDANNSGEIESSAMNMEDDNHTAAISRASSKLLLRSNPVFDGHRPSSKFRSALKLITDRITENDDKVVVVSQWTSVLNMFQEHLQKSRIKHVSLTGQVPVQLRNDIVCQFNSKTSGVKVMLLSLTAGGVGLNLVGGNNLILMDPHWNPQLEAQAQDRVYRVGQTKPVNIYKFLCKETIEERINCLQEAKLSLARDVLSGVRHTGGSKLSIDDMKALFGM